jgi:hypothetical protein
MGRGEDGERSFVGWPSLSEGEAQNHGIQEPVGGRVVQTINPPS